MYYFTPLNQDDWLATVYLVNSQYRAQVILSIVNTRNRPSCHCRSPCHYTTRLSNYETFSPFSFSILHEMLVLASITLARIAALMHRSYCLIIIFLLKISITFINQCFEKKKSDQFQVFLVRTEIHVHECSRGTGCIVQSMWMQKSICTPRLLDKVHMYQWTAPQ